MPNTAGYISVDSIVTDYIDQSEQSIHKYFKLWNIAFRIMDELGLDFFYQVKSIPISVAANKTAAIPDECINWTKIGILNGSGGAFVLGYNNKLTTYASGLPTRLSDVQQGLSSAYSVSSPNFYNYNDGNGFGNLYGSAGSGSGYKIDGNIILFDPYFAASSIILEGVFAPTEGEEYYVPRVFREAMIAGLSFMDLRDMPRSRKGDLSDKRDRRHEYYNARRLASARFNPFNLDLAYISSSENSRLVVKN